MRFGIQSFSTLTILTVTVAWVKSAPVILEKRAPPELLVSLRERNPNTRDWHFGLVIYAPGGITAAGTRDTIHHQVASMNSKCLEYGEHDGFVRPNELKATAEIRSVHENPNDFEALYNSVTNIVKSVPNTPVNPNGNFPNCLDYAVNAVHGLTTQGYVTGADYQKFVDYHTRVAQEVRVKTDHHTVADLTGQTYTGPHPAQPPPEGKRTHSDVESSSSSSSSSSSEGGEGKSSPPPGPSVPKRQRRLSQSSNQA
jgi:hypothetical protein